jgi:recombination protein RecT
MSDNPQPQDGHYDETPGAREKDAAPGQTVEQYFKDLLEKYRDEITAMLAAGLTWSRFMNSCLAAMRRDPSFLEGTTTRSVITALIQSAQDGLVPDGKEGVITPYKNKRSGKREAKWNPMTQGLRKRARETDHMIIDAQVVHEKDVYKRTQGDNPSIIHEPADHLPDRGPMSLVYAIFKREDGNILHREVMNRKQVMDVKGQSSQEDSLMWTKFETEAWRKSVIRRGIKTVPISDALMQVVSRDDDAFVFDHERAELPAPTKRQPPPAPKALEQTQPITLEVPDAKKGEPVPAAGQTVEVVRHEESRTISQDPSVGAAEAEYQDFVKEAYKELGECLNESAVEEIRERVLKDLKAGDIQAWKDACADRAAEVFKGGKKK